MSHKGFSRRHFFYGALLAGAVPAGGFGSTQSLSRLGYKSPNEKLNLASIGAGGQPFSDLRNAVADVENVVALADVDFVRGTPGFTLYPKAEKYNDYRQMLDRQHKGIDAVVIGTADHMHAHCAIACMQLGKHVYVEKPLTRTASEARLLAQAAAKYKVATQMGNQGYSHEATRVATEIIWSGEIGDVSEVHSFRGRPQWPQGMTKIPPPTPVPSTLNWDVWLGCAAWRPYTGGDQEYVDFVNARNAGRGGGRAAAPPAPAGAPGAAPGAGAGRGGGGGGRGTPQGPAGLDYGFYLPFNWRGFYDFGSSLIGDWGVHQLGPANWALNLDPKYLISVECISKNEYPPFTFPNEMTIKYEFGPRPGMPPVNVFWYQKAGGDAYMPPGMSAEEARAIPGTGPQLAGGRGGGGGGRGQGAAGAGGRAAGAAGAPGGAPGGAPAGAPGAAGPGGRGGGGAQGSGYNTIFVGSKGYLGTTGRGEGVGLIPGKRWADYRLPNAYLTRSPGHQRDWIRACKGGSPSCSDFSIAGPYTEWLVLGSAAVHFDGKLMWDNARGEFSNGKQVLQWVKPTYRKGWELKL